MSKSRSSALRIVPMTPSAANVVVGNIHRHHGPAMALEPRFSIGAVTDAGRLCGVAIVGRPINRNSDDGLTAEVLRVAVDGTPNASSALLAASVRVAREMGYARIITYTLDEESGASLRGAGWVCAGRAKKTEWHRAYASNGNGRRGAVRDHAEKAKLRWERQLRDPFEVTDMELAIEKPAHVGQMALAVGVEETPQASQPGSDGAMPSPRSIPWGSEPDESRMTEDDHAAAQEEIA